MRESTVRAPPRKDSSLLTNLTFSQKLLNDSHLCACEQATCGSISRFFECTEESFGGFQFMAEEARGGAVFLVGVVTLGEATELRGAEAFTRC